MGERELMVSTPLPVEYVEEDEEALETSFQALEIVGTTSVETEGDPRPSRVAIMAAKVLISNDFQPGKGLGKEFDGMTKPVVIRSLRPTSSRPSRASRSNRLLLGRPTQWSNSPIRRNPKVLATSTPAQLSRYSWRSLQCKIPKGRIGNSVVILLQIVRSSKSQLVLGTKKPKVARGDHLDYQRTLEDLILSILASEGEPLPSTMAIIVEDGIIESRPCSFITFTSNPLFPAFQSKIELVRLCSVSLHSVETVSEKALPSPYRTSPCRERVDTLHSRQRVMNNIQLPQKESSLRNWTNPMPISDMDFQEDMCTTLQELQDLQKQITELTTIVNQLHFEIFGCQPSYTIPNL
ncbi:hypothetical protein CR513_42166, partial [Mucuna pruriens]